MDEFLDVYDVNGKYLGIKSRSFCHTGSPGVYHKPVCIWFKNSKGEILVQKRAKCKKTEPNKWDFSAAGHPIAGEGPIEAALREIKEELGLEFQPTDLHFLKETLEPTLWEFVQIYIIYTDAKISDMTLQQEETQDVRWVTYKEFCDLLYSNEFCDHPKSLKDLMANLLK